MCPYALPSKNLVHCRLADIAVDPRKFPCFDNYEECPIYKAESEGDCRKCPLYGFCPQTFGK